MADARLGLGPLPPAPGQYDRVNEQAFRQQMDSLRRSVEQYVAGTRNALEADLEGTGIGDLADVTETSVGDGEVLQFDNASSEWINQTLAEAGISAVGHNHVEADITDLDHYKSADFDTDFAGKSTTDLSEGTNLYYTNARADARIALATLADLASADASQLDAGVLADARVKETNVTQHEAALSVTESQISDLDHYEDADVEGYVDGLSAIAPLLLVTPENIENLPGYSFTRATTATYVDASGVIQTASAGELRTAHYIDGVRHWLTEPASTNGFVESQDFSGWTQRNGCTITANTGEVTAPDGTATANKVADIAGGTQDCFQTQGGFTASTALAASIYLRPVVASGEITIANPIDGSLGDWTVDLSLLSTTEWARLTSIHEAVTVVTSFASRADGFSGFHIRNEIGDAGPHDVYVWGAQLEESSFPTSYIPTSGTAVTRNADELQATGVSPQESTVLIDGTELGAISTTGAKLLQLGNAAPLLAVMEDSGGYIERHNDSTNTDNTAALSAAPDYGDRLELAAQLSSAGTPTLVQSINSAAEESATDATPNASLQANYGDANLYIGWDGTSNHAAVAFRRILIVSDTQSMDDMRGEGSFASLVRKVGHTTREVTGARNDGEGALANLLTALAAEGLITDSTTAT